MEKRSRGIRKKVCVRMKKIIKLIMAFIRGEESNKLLFGDQPTVVFKSELVVVGRQSTARFSPWVPMVWYSPYLSKDGR